ncbi:MAG: hypothetical protein M0R03_17390 [Novosphingobium sp.]|nr:hypothetical protein [Novosphingobium sp.]
MGKTFSAPKAYVEIDGIPAGYIQGLTWTENFNRQPITGLGELIEQESPAVNQRNTFTINKFFITLKENIIKKIMNREATVEEFINTISMEEFTFDIVVYKKTVTASNNSVKLVTSVDKTGQTIVNLRRCLVDSQNWSISEGGVAMFNITGRYLTPVTV